MSNILKNITSTTLGLKGKTPEIRSAAKPEVSIHSPIKTENSVFDLDGKLPTKYLDGEFN
jgi:hypothetical protein